jgi:hypothetical protein
LSFKAFKFLLHGRKFILFGALFDKIFSVLVSLHSKSLFYLKLVIVTIYFIRLPLASYCFSCLPCCCPLAALASFTKWRICKILFPRNLKCVLFHDVVDRSLPTRLNPSQHSTIFQDRHTTQIYRSMAAVVPPSLAIPQHSEDRDSVLYRGYIIQSSPVRARRI